MGETVEPVHRRERRTPVRNIGFAWKTRTLCARRTAIITRENTAFFIIFVVSRSVKSPCFLLFRKESKKREQRMNTASE